MRLRPIDTLSTCLRVGDCDHIIQSDNQQDRQLMIICASVIHDLPLGNGDVTLGGGERAWMNPKKARGQAVKTDAAAATACPLWIDCPRVLTGRYSIGS